LQTFSTSLGEVALQPSTGGIFKIYLYNEERAASKDEPATIQEYLLWDRKAEGGFPGMAPLTLFLKLCRRGMSETRRHIVKPGQRFGLEEA